MNFVDTVNLVKAWVEHNLSATVSVRRNPHPSPGPESGSAASGRGNNHHRPCMCLVSTRQISAVYWEADQPPPPTAWVYLPATHFQNLAFSLFLQNNMSAFSALEDVYVQCSLLSIQQTQIFLAYFPWEWGKICMHKYWGEAQLVILTVTWENRPWCTNIYYYLMFGYLIYKEVLPWSHYTTKCNKSSMSGRAAER